jgi:dinuclear metal center YbgI/SA1388 family protein
MTHLEALAPLKLAEEWDNCGLQVGDRNRLVRRIMVALDPLPEVVQEACDNKIDLLITHHPLLIRPLKQIDLTSDIGGIVSRCVAHRLAIYAAHTNLDASLGGLNDHLADLLHLEARRPLQAAAGPARARCRERKMKS